MKMNAVSIIVFLLLFCTHPCLLNAQLKRTFSKGVVTLQDGQVLQGFIRNDEMAKMNYSIVFKATEDAAATTVYDTARVKSFKLDDGDIFELLKFREADTTEAVSVLAKLITHGKASLYKIIYHSEQVYLVTVDANLYVLQDDKKDAGMTATDVTYHHFKEILFGALAGADISSDYAERMSFSERDIRDMISRYNISMGAENTIVASREKVTHYILTSAGGMIKSSAENEIYVQAVYRMYFAKISRSTSLNIGIDFFKDKYTDLRLLYYGTTFTVNYTSTLVTVPVYVQQNILNKNIRPYVFAGMNASYWKIVDGAGVSHPEKAFQHAVGIALLYGGGIEVNVYRGLLIKGEYRQENYEHLVLAGIGYIFGTNKK